MTNARLQSLILKSSHYQKRLPNPIALPFSGGNLLCKSGIGPELFLSDKQTRTWIFETIYSVFVLHNWRQMYTLLCNLFCSFSIKSSPLFIWGTDGWSSSLGICLQCFQFWAFTKKAPASMSGTALPGCISEKLSGPCFPCLQSERV